VALYLHSLICLHGMVLGYIWDTYSWH